MSESNFNRAVHTPVEKLTVAQKKIIQDNVNSLSPEEKKTFASILGEKKEEKKTESKVKAKPKKRK